jgi:hypothetical protein
MGERNVRHGFDFFHLENAQIGLPLMEPIQRVMIGAEILGRRLRVTGSIEHPAQGNAIHEVSVNSKADNPSGKLIHHHQNPVRS